MEYKTINLYFDYAYLEEELNRQSRDGWEFVCIIPPQKDVSPKAIFKRQKQ